MWLTWSDYDRWYVFWCFMYALYLKSRSHSSQCSIRSLAWILPLGSSGCFSHLWLDREFLFLKVLVQKGQWKGCSEEFFTGWFLTLQILYLRSFVVVRGTFFGLMYHSIADLDFLVELATSSLIIFLLRSFFLSSRFASLKSAPLSLWITVFFGY